MRVIRNLRQDVLYLTAKDFWEKVRGEAYWLYRRRESRHRLDDWQDAQNQLAAELGRFPTQEETKARAQEIYEKMKSERAQKDWLQAIAKVRQRYDVPEEQQIREQAWSIYLNRQWSNRTGTPEEDWFDAERQVLQILNGRPFG